MSIINRENLLSILSNFKTKVIAEIAAAKPTKLSDLTNDTSYSTLTEVQTQAQAALDSAKTYTNTAIGGITQFKTLKADVLPDVAGAQLNTIYLIPITSSNETDNIYDEFLVIDSKWEHLGTTKIDLSGYDTATEVDAKILSATPVTMTAEDITAFNSTLWS